MYTKEDKEKGDEDRAHCDLLYSQNRFRECGNFMLENHLTRFYDIAWMVSTMCKRDKYLVPLAIQLLEAKNDFKVTQAVI